MKQFKKTDILLIIMVTIRVKFINKYEYNNIYKNTIKTNKGYP